MFTYSQIKLLTPNINEQEEVKSGRKKGNI